MEILEEMSDKGELDYKTYLREVSKFQKKRLMKTKKE